MDHDTSPELRDYRWKKRLLLLFAPDEQHPAHLEQRRLLAGREAAMEERDLLLFELFVDSGRIDRQQLPARTVARLRSDFGVRDSDVALLLVGKDGGVKRRETGVVSPDDLFAQIDGMPMRRREMAEDQAR